MKKLFHSGKYFYPVLLLLVTSIYGLDESTSSGGSNAQAVHLLDITGKGVNIALIASKNAYDNHEAFFDKDSNGVPIGSTHLFNYDFSDTEVNFLDHDTWMSGIAASRGGVAYPNNTGVAPDADIHCGRVINDSNQINPTWLENALEELIDNQNCRVVMTGLAFDAAQVPPDGNSIYTLMYDYFAYSRGVIFANGAGNGDNQIQPFGDAYNGITTGGVVTTGDDIYDKAGSLSSSGLTDDGRRKPDVGAPTNMQTVPHIGPGMWWVPPWNDGRTSLAGPHTAGIAALLLELADGSADPCDGKSEVIKAAIVNSAFPNIKDELGQSTNPADSNNTWQKDRGYGRVDALGAYEQLNSPRINPGETTSENKGWACSSLSQGQNDIYDVNVPKNHRLVATVTWQREVVWIDKRPWNKIINDGELHPYLADLDMEIFKPNDVNAIFNEQIAGLSEKDNLEKCDILISAEGTYTIKITNNSTNTESAAYGFAFRLVGPIVADFNLDYIVDTNDLELFTDEWLQVGGDCDIAGDLNVNFHDYSLLLDNWLLFNPAYVL